MNAIGNNTPVINLSKAHFSHEQKQNDTRHALDHEAIDNNSKTKQISEEQSLTEQQLREISALEARDHEVRNHDQAHLSAAGSYAIGGASFSYQVGPNGVRYAIAGEVKIDTSEVAGDPQATLRKAETIRRAALAPAQPSAQDQQVAAQASAMMTRAQAELLNENNQQQSTQQDKEQKLSVHIDV